MHLRTLKFVILFSLSFLSLQNSFAIDREEAVMYASFVLGLLGGVQSSSQGSEVCALGHDEIVVAMGEKNRNLINVENNPEKYTSCKMLYIAKDKSKGLRSYIEKYNRRRIATVSLLENFNESGGMILVQMGRRNFELSVNSKEIKEAGIKLAPLVLELVINN